MTSYRSYQEYSAEEMRRLYKAFVAAGGNPVGIDRFREIGLALERLPCFSEEAAELHEEAGSERLRAYTGAYLVVARQA